MTHECEQFCVEFLSFLLPLLGEIGVTTEDDSKFLLVFGLAYNELVISFKYVLKIECFGYGSPDIRLIDPLHFKLNIIW